MPRGIIRSNRTPRSFVRSLALTRRRQLRERSVELRPMLDAEIIPFRL